MPPRTKPAPALEQVRYVFLDRDGVINRKLAEGKYVTRCQDFQLLPGVAQAIRALNASGRTVVVVTNQRGVALGLMTRADLEEVHTYMRAELAREGASLDAVYFCPHDYGQCHCRKPGIGMLRNAFRDFPGATPRNSILIGDSHSDIECGRRAGMTTILVRGPAEAESAVRQGSVEAASRIADAVADSLADAVNMLG